MKLIDELNKKNNALEIAEEKKSVLEEDAVELSDDFLEEVSGGVIRRTKASEKLTLL